MPSRTRAIGPEISELVADNIREIRENGNLSRPELSRRLAVLGYPMSPKVLENLELGITEHGETRTRLVTVDEAFALAKALEVPVGALFREEG
jgi:transcriptional regulator with XRE-family HTH domain